MAEVVLFQILVSVYQDGQVAIVRQVGRSHTHLHTHTHTHTHTLAHTRTHARKHTHTHTYIYIHVHTSAVLLLIPSMVLITKGYRYTEGNYWQYRLYKVLIGMYIQCTL